MKKISILPEQGKIEEYRIREMFGTSSRDNRGHEDFIHSLLEFVETRILERRGGEYNAADLHNAASYVMSNMEEQILQYWNDGIYDRIADIVWRAAQSFQEGRTTFVEMIKDIIEANPFEEGSVESEKFLSELRDVSWEYLSGENTELFSSQPSKGGPNIMNRLIQNPRLK